MKYNDYELVYLIRQDSEEAFSLLVEQYSPLIGSLAKKFRAKSIEYDDFFQVGLMALISSIETYNEYLDSSFYSYAMTCIKNSILSFHRRANIAVKDEYQLGDYYDYGFACEENRAYHFKETLDNYIDEKLIIDKVLNHEKILSEFEKRCLKYYLMGHNYNEIALILSMPPKKVDNALNRLKMKLKSLKK